MSMRQASCLAMQRKRDKLDHYKREMAKPLPRPKDVTPEE